jgi:hypothetical protein
MKKYVLLIAVFIIAINALSQQVPRDKVIIEIGTATW